MSVYRAIGPLVKSFAAHFKTFGMQIGGMVIFIMRCLGKDRFLSDCLFVCLLELMLNVTVNS